MAQEKQQGGISVNIPGGLNTDSSLVNQPEGTTRFVFTGVNETKEGDLGFIANEESNQECYDLNANTTLGPGYVPMGKVYIGDENSAIFLANPNGNSAIIIVDKNCNVVVSFSDKNQTEKMGFSVAQQIDATFRLRRGCERVVYWVDPKPRMFILDKEEEYKNPTTGNWDVSKFNLFKTYKKIPVVLDLEVVDAGGVLPPGSYNFSIQYLDEDFNPTEFVTSTETVMIYNVPSTSSYREKRGATMEKNDSYLNFENSNKAIKIVFDPNSLDTTFPFYRLAITEANAGGGLISDTKYTSEISTRNSTFYYTGLNYESTGTQAEVTMFNNIIEKAQSIEQIENRLVLGDIEGKQVNYCKLQKYASKINTDLITKTVIVSTADKSNVKDPAAHFNGIGYMPGEIYSLAIVYIFADNSVSPAFHIPGKSLGVPLNYMFSAGTSVYPMSNVNNACTDTRYIDNNTCGEDTFWGEDSQGDSLTNQAVRHHRFPLRTDYNIPFVTKVPEGSALSFIKTLNIVVSKTGAICPAECPTTDPPSGCVDTLGNFGSPVTFGPYVYTVNYTEDSTPGVIASTIDPYLYVVTVGDNTTQNVNYNANSGNLYGASVVITDIEETFDYPTLPNTVAMSGPTLDPITGMYYYTGTSTVTTMTYKIVIGIGVQDASDPLYSSEIFGLNFSNIHKPSLTDTNGQEVTGYYIVRHERTEADRTVVDSAVLTSTTKEKNFVAQGLLFPQYATPGEQAAKIKKDTVGLIYPEHKFNSRKYSTFNKIVQQGKFNKIKTISSRTKIRDVSDGTGYVSGKHKDGESDDDGFTIQIKTRDNITNFEGTSQFTLDSTNIKELYYLNALEDKLTHDSTDTGIDVFNLACDNRVGIIQLKQDYTFNTVSSLPYVYLYRDIVEPYSNFRLTPYYKESRNPETFDPITNVGTVAIWNGDSYISSIRYVNSVYFDTRMKKRAGKTSVWNYIIAFVLVVVAVVVTIFSFGLGTVAAVGLVSLAVGLVGVATTLTISGIQQDAWNKAYNILYNQGLRETITDSYMQDDVDPINGEPRGFRKNPQDDEIQWLGDCANLWFESAVNIGLRHGATDNTPDFLNAPGLVESGTTYSEWNREYFGINSVGSAEVPPTTALDFHMVKKLTYLDANRKGGRAYIGLAAAEVYALNPDYTRRNRQKAFNHLGLEYDCCSDCVETFPHRFHWSEQAFQEEVTDNFRMFLPNNYKDLEAETGKITDLFRIQNNLYVHTEEGLWHCPQTFQERVTNDIISFIGTGEYFSVPPRKIVDDANSSAGNIHKWARTKTKHGVLFPSFKEKKWYLFNGQQLKPISDNGNSNYFKTHMDFLVEQQYYAANSANYPYRNNPSNPLGVGFLSTYDTNKERLIITKKDMKITNLPTTSYELCTEGAQTIIFPNMAQTIATRLAAGWNYIGIEDCKMKFEKTTYETTTTIANQYTSVANDIDIWAFFDTSGSFSGSDLAQIDASLDDWIANDLVPTGWAGNIYKVNTSSEKWLDFPSQIPLADRNKVLLISFVNEAEGGPVSAPYHNSALNFTGQPTAIYTTHYNAFTGVGGLYSTFDKFIGINYPIATVAASKAFILHSLAAVKGSDYTLTEVNSIPVNSYFSGAEWTSLKSQLLNNPYKTLLDPNGDPGLEQYNWFVKPDRSNLGSPLSADCPASTLIISPCQFAVDMNTILASLTEVTPVEITNTYPVTSVQYETGQVFVPQTLNNGYTMSYSLKREEWVGWHPYIPSFYMHVQEKFYSWTQGSRYLFKHNRPNHYQTFYGVRYPFIVEYVDNPSAMTTKIWDSLLFQTEAKKFDPISEEYLDQRYVTFNKALFYNTQQTSGIITLAPKQDSNINYLLQQTNNALGVATIDRNERDWTMNSMRDIRIDYTIPMFLKDLPSLQSSYYIDKVVNPAAIDYNKDWTQLESFRDKFLVVRLIFDNFADTRLIFNFSALQRAESER
jgi:hypothetical protein